MKFSERKIQCFCYISISVLSWMRRAFCNLLKTLDISENIGWYSSTESNYKKFKEIWDAFETFCRISRGVPGCIFEFPNSKMCDIVLIGVYFLGTKLQDHITSSFLVMQICIFSFWKAMLQIASQNFPELNALNFFSVTVKDTGLLDSQRKINLIIFHLNYILIHVNIFPYSVLN